jgi:hypothetical protein
MPDGASRPRKKLSREIWNRAYDSSAMPHRLRPHRIQVKLDEDEYTALVREATARDTTKSQVVRDAIRAVAGKDRALPICGLARPEALTLLAAAARDGSVTAATVLARELRLEPVEPELPPTMTGSVRLHDLPSGALRLIE